LSGCERFDTARGNGLHMIGGKGQIWIETVLYTLIGLALIGVSLAIITPKINSMRERVIVEQTTDLLAILDSKINEVVEKGPGNKRVIEKFSMKEGEMFINSTGEEIVFVLKGLKSPYSEVGIPIMDGRVEIVTLEAQKGNDVYLTLRYSSVNITYPDEELKKFNAAATPYSFVIENVGLSEVVIEEMSGR
jgi:type II secretory pathway pseudopilin PulG